MTLTASEVRALAWLESQYKSTGMDIVQFRDRADVGWLWVTGPIVGRRGRRTYIVSPTGRVWHYVGWNDPPDMPREEIEATWVRESPIREADYMEVAS